LSKTEDALSAGIKIVLQTPVTAAE